LGSVALTFFFFSYIFIFITRCSLWGIGFASKAKKWMKNMDVRLRVEFSNWVQWHWHFCLFLNIHFYYQMQFMDYWTCGLLTTGRSGWKTIYVKYSVELQNGNWVHCHWNIFLFFVFVTSSAMDFSTCAH